MVGSMRTSVTDSADFIWPAVRPMRQVQKDSIFVVWTVHKHDFSNWKLYFRIFLCFMLYCKVILRARWTTPLIWMMFWVCVAQFVSFYDQIEINNHLLLCWHHFYKSKMIFLEAPPCPPSVFGWWGGRPPHKAWRPGGARGGAARPPHWKFR